MTAHHEPHGGGHHSGGHGGSAGAEWLEMHLGGPVMAFGKAFEHIVERAMVPAIQGVFPKLARWYLVLMAPLVALELLSSVVRF